MFSSWPLDDPPLPFKNSCQRPYWRRKNLEINAPTLQNLKKNNQTINQPRKTIRKPLIGHHYKSKPLTMFMHIGCKFCLLIWP